MPTGPAAPPDVADLAIPRPTWAIALRVALGFALGLTILVGATWAMNVDRHALVAAIRRAQPWALVFNVVAMLLLFLISTLRWHTVMQPTTGLRYREALLTTMASFVLNAVLPARGGDMVRVHYVGVRTGVPRARVLGAELMD